MSYIIPKSQIVIKSTPGGEFKDERTGIPYVGEYMETLDGFLYQGSNNLNPGNRLIPINPPSKKQKTIRHKTVAKFNLLKPKVRDFITNTEPIPSMKRYPTEEDYTLGYFHRYFTKRINDTYYLEISKETYDSMINKEKIYDYNLYEVGQIKWYLVGNVFKSNSLEIEKAERQWKNLSHFFPIFNEFQRPTIPNQEGLYTPGGELYRADGTEYIGEYHIHTTIGPMEGPIHTENPHPKLYYLSQLPTPRNMDYEDFLKEYPPPNIPSEIPTTTEATPNRGEGTIPRIESYNCIAQWGIPPSGYSGFINSDGQAPLSSTCVDPGDGTGVYKYSEYASQALSTCQSSCDGTTETFGIGCLWPFDPNHCSSCDIHDVSLCTGIYMHNVEDFNTEQEQGAYTCFCGNYDGLPYYSQVCC